MKVPTVHPQLLAAVFVGAALIGTHVRGYDNAVLSAELRSAPSVPVIADSLVSAPVIRPQRDPFVAPVNERHEQVATSGGKIESDVSLESSGTSLHLRAVVMGSHKYALVADGKFNRIVTLGSSLAGSIVTDISLHGVGLANGARFLPEDSNT
jgi:hypothetical protein